VLVPDHRCACVGLCVFVCLYVPVPVPMCVCACVSVCASQAVRPPDVEGYLWKLAADGRLGGWKRRFFFTRDRDLYYARAHSTRTGEPAAQSTEAVGVIPLEDGAWPSMRVCTRHAASIGTRMGVIVSFGLPYMHTHTHTHTCLDTHTHSLFLSFKHTLRTDA
jgi:hypothetical protein